MSARKKSDPQVCPVETADCLLSPVWHQALFRAPAAHTGGNATNAHAATPSTGARRRGQTHSLSRGSAESRVRAYAARPPARADSRSAGTLGKKSGCLSCETQESGLGLAY